MVNTGLRKKTVFRVLCHGTAYFSVVLLSKTIGKVWMGKQKPFGNIYRTVGYMVCLMVPLSHGEVKPSGWWGVVFQLPTMPMHPADRWPKPCLWGKPQVWPQLCPCKQTVRPWISILPSCRNGFFGLAPYSMCLIIWLIQAETGGKNKAIDQIQSWKSNQKRLSFEPF